MSYVVTHIKMMSYVEWYQSTCGEPTSTERAGKATLGLEVSHPLTARANGKDLHVPLAVAPKYDFKYLVEFREYTFVP
jgi:hypothetical protein